jgi:hypothetical protein
VPLRRSQPGRLQLRRRGVSIPVRHLPARPLQCHDSNINNHKNNKRHARQRLDLHIIPLKRRRLHERKVLFLYFLLCKTCHGDAASPVFTTERFTSKESRQIKLTFKSY